MMESSLFIHANYCGFSKLLQVLYRINRARPIVTSVALKSEGGEFYSGTVRELLLHYHGVRVDEYSYGSCMIPGAWPAGVTVGRYVSVGTDVKIYLRNHPMERLSMHPFFYNRKLGYVDSDNIPGGALEIGHDAWIGSNVIFTAGCDRVGVGAVIGAGSIVTKDVPDFAVIAGNPARLLRYRFDDRIREQILAGKWWELPVDACLKHMESMVKPLGNAPFPHPLLKSAS